MAASPNAPRIAVDDSGNAIAVWQHSDGPITHIWTNRYVAGTGWGTAQRLDTAPGVATGLSLATHPNGEAIAAWNQGDSLGRPVWAAPFHPQTGWAAPVRLENGPGIFSLATAVTFDSAGDAFAVWSSLRQPSSARTMWESQYR